MEELLSMNSPFTLGIIYIILGMVFVFFSIQQITMHGWGVFAFVLILLATWDIGSGIRMMFTHLKKKKKK